MPSPPKKFCLFVPYQALILALLVPCIVFSQSKSRLDSLETAFEQETNDSLQVIKAIDLSRYLHRKEQDEDKEYRYAERAVEKALQLNDTIMYAKALDNLGLLHRYHQYYNEAIDLHIKAFQLVEHKDVPPILKMIFANNAGVAARYNQKYDTAISYYMKALKLAETENNIKNIAISNNGIGNTLSNMPKRQDEAINYFNRSLQAEKQLNDSLGIAMNYLSIGDYYIDKEAYATAREYLGELLKLNTKRNDPFGLAITYEYMGLAFLKQGKDLQKATLYFNKALDRFKELNNRHRQAGILSYLGNVELQKNNLVQAETYYRESLALSKTLNQHSLIIQNSFKLSEIFEQENNPKQALQYYKQGKIYEDSIKLTEQNVRIEGLTRKYNLEQKENHIQLLEKDKELQQTELAKQKQELERRRSVTVLLGIGFFLLLIIFFLQYRNMRLKKKNQERIQKEEKEKMNAIYERNLAQAEILVTRLRINPHFLFNSLNAITYLIQSDQNEKAIKYLVIFSRYTRMVLETSKKHVIPIEEELKLTEYYLKLEENRFKKDFTFRITVADNEEVDDKDMGIPPLLLQPFIENAIWHGLLPSKNEVKTLHISCSPTSTGIQISIDDNGVGRKAQKEQPYKKHNSMGIEIIEQRIDLYNKSHAETIAYKIIDKKAEDGSPLGTRVVLTLVQAPVKEYAMEV
ncbi:tetratricopeptide repeat protein [Marixanthomonas spongiae]|uniref:Signal transduction histidine kinase internal region domain-containing protein n=1 Tax=Marixanthomonas spongiae TaxID=2174845 RepID=A0A2U0I8N8_9FLAO|nr:tetratricopeptide repeat protein [Marixanthomonas spongiae]PVW17410.1 hypothetical protein DDV96_02580 [Marixanthomonas spongiae]